MMMKLSHDVLTRRRQEASPFLALNAGQKLEQSFASGYYCISLLQVSECDCALLQVQLN